MGRIAVTGSVAFDTIMVFPGRFGDHILPAKTHLINVSFLVNRLERRRGGTAANIAYTLALLGERPLLCAAVGSDFTEYGASLSRTGVDTSASLGCDDVPTASCFITTDLDDNQITAFHPGAMQHSHINQVADARGIALGIVAPDGRDGMIRHAEQFAAAGIPFIFDPGQGLPMFSAEDLERFVSQATWVTLNEYEWQMVEQRTGWTVDGLARRVEALIVTRGAAGSTIHTRNGVMEIAAAPVRAVVDPTGCGDAYRAGLIHGLLHGLDWRATGHIASLLGAIKIESRGTQNHHFTRTAFQERLDAVAAGAVRLG